VSDFRTHEIVVAGYGGITVPPGGTIPAAPWHRHARLRRTSPIAKYVVAAGLEALGHPDDPEGAAKSAPERLGIVLCIQNGCVNFSKRFYGEVLDTPGFASPILFPETVFNSPASHLGAMLGRTEINYTLIGDAAAFVQGLAVAAHWLAEGRADGVLVIAAEEQDDLTTMASGLFEKDAPVTSGAGAVYLRRYEDAKSAHFLLAALTDTYTFTDLKGRRAAAHEVELDLRGILAMCDIPEDDAMLFNDAKPWKRWPGPSYSTRAVSGNGLAAGGAWQVIEACSQLDQEWAYLGALIPVIGAAEQAGGVFLLRA
jgi:hypothetical protein